MLNEDLIPRHLLGPPCFKYFPSGGAKVLMMVRYKEQFKGPTACEQRNGDVTAIGCKAATVKGKLIHGVNVKIRIYAGQKKPDTREQMFHDFVYMKAHKRQMSPEVTEPGR